MMIEVEGVLVSEELIKEEFVCNLAACKGACCIEGDSGAPLERHEMAILDRIYKDVKPFMTTKGIQAIEEQGTYVIDEDGDLTTTCVEKNKECAYVTWDNGITKCAIEKAYEAGIVDWQKPISCHLYPVRITAYPNFDVLNYDRWHICHAACSFGKKLSVPVYSFLKAPLIRKYGEEWYKALEESVKEQPIV